MEFTSSSSTLSPEPGRPDLKAQVRDFERTLILNALASNGGHQRRTAASLGILPTTLVEKMKRLGINGRRARRAGAPPLMLHA